MAINVNALINSVKDLSTRRALKAVFAQLKADLAANKPKFDDHTHYISATTAYSSKPASEAAGNSTGTRVTLNQNLTNI